MQLTTMYRNINCHIRVPFSTHVLVCFPFCMKPSGLSYSVCIPLSAHHSHWTSGILNANLKTVRQTL